MAVSNHAEVKGGDAQAIIEMVERLSQSEFVDIEGVRYAALPMGKRIESLKPLIDEYRTRPERRSGTARIETLDSVIAHANRFKDGGSALFATAGDMKFPKLVAVYDYHEEGEGEEKARFCGHRAEYAFPLSDEWKAWHELAKGSMTQADFAAALEDRIGDVLDPSGAGDKITEWAARQAIKLASPSQLMELSRGLTINVGQNVAHHVNLSTGEGQIRFEEKHTDAKGGEVKIPGGFMIGIPVFTAGEPYKVPVRLRYRASGGSVTWQVHLHRADLVFRDAFTEACEKAQSETELPLIYGTPETTE